MNLEKYRAVKYSSLFAISCVIRHQFGECSHEMLSPRQGRLHKPVRGDRGTVAQGAQ